MAVEVVAVGRDDEALLLSRRPRSRRSHGDDPAPWPADDEER